MLILIGIFIIIESVTFIFCLIKNDKLEIENKLLKMQRESDRIQYNYLMLFNQKAVYEKLQKERRDKINEWINLYYN